jgi:hypothetical protein
LLGVEVAFDEAAGAINGGIVYDDHLVVGIILHDDGLDVVEVSVLGRVVVGRNYNTEGQFFIFSDGVTILIEGLFVQVYLVDGLGISVKQLSKRPCTIQLGVSDAC